jgi:phosphoglycerate dehydrogenase-like enzyme
MEARYIDMKTAFIMNESTRNMVLNQKAVDYFKSIGEVSFNTGDTTKESVIRVIEGADIAVTSWGNTALDGEILAVCPGLKFLAHAAGSVKPVVSDELWVKGIRVLSSACPLGEGVAETALGFTISACKNFYNLNSSLHNGGWNEGKENIRELFDLKIGVIGCGWAGKHYIKLLQNFYVDVYCCDPFINTENMKKLGAEKAELDWILKNCDVISVHAPSIPSTNHMLNKDTLELMKKDAVLINTARGTIIDEVALYEHMAAGNLKYACIDVFDPEPPVKENKLFTLPNVITTPHLAGLAQNGLRRIGTFVCEETEHFLKGLPVRGEVTKEMLANMA